MKKFLFYLIFIFSALIFEAQAQHMVHESSYLKHDLLYIGLPDYPPFSKYTHIQRRIGDFVTDMTIQESAFLKPMQKIAQKYGFKIDQYKTEQVPSLEDVILNIRSNEAQLFFGAYANTKIFTGVELVYPASVSNPIHVITLPDVQEKIKSTKDLARLKGVMSKTEFLSDFVSRKLQNLKITYVETPYDAYETLFTGDADYIIGGMYYNKIMASRYGIGQYLAYSSKPIFKIPAFIALSKLMPQMSLYKKDLSAEFSKPQFGNEVKKEILRIVEEEISKNQGIVPPAFAKKVEQEIIVAPAEDDETTEQKSGGTIIEQKIEEKSIDDVLDGI